MASSKQQNRLSNPNELSSEVETFMLQSCDLPLPQSVNPIDNCPQQHPSLYGAFYCASNCPFNINIYNKNGIQSPVKKRRRVVIDED